MKIIQIVPTISYGDAVGNDTLALMNEIECLGYETAIYAENIDKRINSDKVYSIDDFKCVNKDDIIIYHLSIGTQLNYTLPGYECKKIIIYHNITPENFFEDYSKMTYSICKYGREGALNLSDKVSYCLADSQYNKDDLKQMGYKCEIDVLPILIPYDDYRKKPDDEVLSKYGEDGYTNILFTGRIAPNKKQEDIIKSFFYYQKYYNNRSRLFLVGSWDGMQNYYERLKSYTELLGVENVIFTGHISFEEILAYYRLADLFLCMSEHEGFCVPLIEAMFFGVPIIAYDSSAVGETMGKGGILVKNKNSLEIAGMIHHLLNNESLRNKLATGQKERLDYFSNERVKALFSQYIDKFINMS